MKVTSQWKLRFANLGDLCFLFLNKI